MKMHVELKFDENDETTEVTDILNKVREVRESVYATKVKEFTVTVKGTFLA